MTIADSAAALDERIFSDYEQLKRSFYLFFMKTPRAESVIAADDMAFLDRLWEDWSPDYDAAEDLYRAKQCLREPDNLSAAIGYYRADEPGLYQGARQRIRGRERGALRTPHTYALSPRGPRRLHRLALVDDAEHTFPAALEWMSSKVAVTFHLESPKR